MRVLDIEGSLAIAGRNISYGTKPRIIAERLHPLEEGLFSINLWEEFFAVYATIEFTRKRKTVRRRLLVSELPDYDDWESHGVYNLLHYGRATPEHDKTTSALHRTKMWEMLESVARSPDLLKQTTPSRFEEIVAGIFERHGFSTKSVGKTGDGGIDILAVYEHELSPTLHLIQCKQYSHPVGVSIIGELYGVKTDLKASHAILVTTSGFTKGAKEFAERNTWEIGLIDFEKLEKLLKELKMPR